jgi:hypothetical protein
MTLRRSRRGNLLMGHPFKLFSLTGGPHTSVTDIKEVKIEFKEFTLKEDPMS